MLIGIEYIVKIQIKIVCNISRYYFDGFLAVVLLFRGVPNHPYRYCIFLGVYKSARLDAYFSYDNQ